MNAPPIEFADTYTALVTLRAMVETLKEVSASGDLKATKVMYTLLTGAFTGVTKFAQRLGGKSTSLGESFPPQSWKEMPTRDIIIDIYNMAAIDEIGIEIKGARLLGASSAEGRQLSKEITKASRVLRNKIRSAKLWLIKNRPGSWGPDEEEGLKKWL